MIIQFPPVGATLTSESRQVRISIVLSTMLSRFGETMSRPKWEGNTKSG